MDFVREHIAPTFGLRSKRQVVDDERQRPSAMELPKLRPTLQLWCGMVENNGHPQQRLIYHRERDEPTVAQVKQRAAELRKHCEQALQAEAIPDADRLQENLEACAQPVSKRELLEYIRSGTRLDMEQVVAMTIGYLAGQAETEFVKIEECDEFDEDTDASIVEQLITDPGTVDMLRSTWMWREAGDYDLQRDQRKAAQIRKQRIILTILHWAEEKYPPNSASFTAGMQTLRRRRPGMKHTQHLTLPAELMPETDDEAERALWSMETNHYGNAQKQQKTIPTAAAATDAPVQIISKHHFNRIQRLLCRVSGRRDPTSVYVRDVEALIRDTGSLAPERLAALEQTSDAAAVAFGFVAVMRQRQLKVVSDAGWTRFLAKGEGAHMLQNSPHVLTGFEGVLVWRASDLRALSAVRCPQGVRDHFSTGADIRARARRVCELMERYVEVFGAGKRENLVYTMIGKGRKGGSGRGPVDMYNALCDEVRDCKTRAKAAGVALDIGPVHKFLAKDIMHWNDAWKDDAFANGKEPGWVAYLAELREEEEEEMDVDR